MSKGVVIVQRTNPGRPYLATEDKVSDAWTGT